MKSVHKWAIFGALLMFSFGTLAPREVLSQGTIRASFYGIDRFGNPVLLPSLLCVLPGHELRLGADVIDSMRQRYFVSPDLFTWILTRQSGAWEQWSGASWPSGSFRRGMDFPDAVYVTVPNDIGTTGKLEVGTRGYPPSMVFLVNAANTPYANCQWGYGDIYSRGPQPPVYQPPYPFPQGK